MTNQSKRLASYVERHAEPEAVEVASRVTGCYRHALVIPCFDEPRTLLPKLLPPDARELLVVLVANKPTNASADASRRTRALLEALRTASGAEAVHDPARHIGVLCIDRVSTPVPERQGVGLARKIGTDCAAALWLAGKLSNPWIYATDADVALPVGYFRAGLPSKGAAVFPFRHWADTPKQQLKADLYELHLRYYKQRLAWAGSRYAFHTLGSTMAVSLEDYATVRGYPRRNAGEDFYLLNKLAKVAPITALAAPTLKIKARPSSRTPFGTGAALARMHDTRAYPSYAPRSFELLREVLAALEAAGDFAGLCVSAQARAILEDLGLPRFFDGALRQHRSSRGLHSALLDWFDGLRTLRFVHECRRYFPDQPLQQSIAALYPELVGASAAAQVQHLAAIDGPSRNPVTAVMGHTSQSRQVSPRATPA